MPRESVAGAPCLLMLAVLAHQGTPSAQEIVRLTPADMPRWDAAVYTGWYGASKAEAAPWDEWVETGVGGAVVGFAWARQWRTELDVSFAGTGTLYSQDTLFVPSQGTTIVRTYPRLYRDSGVAASVIFQPFENRWVHPFIGVGVGVVREHLRIESPQSTYYGRSGPFVIPGQPTTTDVRYRAEPHLVGGAKLYVSESAFIRTDMRLGASRDDHASALLRIGFGFEF